MKKKQLIIIISVLLVLSLLVSCSDGEKPVGTGSAEATVYEEEKSTEGENSYSPVQTDPGFDESDYVLTFFDDFEGTALDMTKWSYCPDWERGNVGGRWDRSMISLDGAGSLVVTSDHIRNENGTVIPISGAIRTVNKFEQCRGYFEIRCKLQSAKGFWFAFWLMCEGEKATTDGITNGAEIDIVEAFDVEDGLVNHALHWDGYGSKMRSVGRPVRHKECYDGEYHTFSLLWDDDGYRFYVDGELSTAIIKGQYDFPGICEVPTYLKITSEFGTWSSYYDINELPDSVLVDYVKVYAAK